MRPPLDIAVARSPSLCPLPFPELQAVRGPFLIHREALFSLQGIFKNLDWSVTSSLGLLGLVWFSTFHFYFILICKFV